MKLSRGQIHTLFVGLTSLDNQLKKCEPDTRFKIGLNLEKLRPIASAFERAQQRVIADAAQESKKAGDGKKESEADLAARVSKLNADTGDAIEAARAQEIEVDLMMILRTELKMAENADINGVTIGQILPILEGIEMKTPAKATESAS